MGKLKGIIQFTGSFDGLSFYESGGRIIVRKTGGFDGKKIKTQPEYARVRENGSEFGHVARVCKNFRQGLKPDLSRMGIEKVHNRLVSLFHDIMQLDTLSVRGKRTVVNGLQTPTAMELINAFELHPTEAFSRHFPFATSIDLTEGTLTVPHFVPNLLSVPVGTTHLSLQFWVAGMDSEMKEFSKVMYSEELSLLLTPSADGIPLTLSCAVPEAPLLFYGLKLTYVQETNGTFHPLFGTKMKILGFRF